MRARVDAVGLRPDVDIVADAPSHALADAAASVRVPVSPAVRARYDAAYRERWQPAVLATLR